MLVSGDYLLTVHEERVSLPDVLAPYTPEGRSEQYVIYAVLDAMVASAFEALNELELTLDDASGHVDRPARRPGADRRRCGRSARGSRE